MLSNSEKFILDKILYDSLSTLLRINRNVGNYEIISSNNTQIVSQIFLNNIWKKTNKFLNETNSDNINDAIQEWSNNLEEKVKEIYDESLPEIQKLSQLPLTNLENKKYFLQKSLYNLISTLVNVNVSKNNLYTSNILLSRSIKFYVLSEYIITFLSENINLEPVELTNLLLSNNKNIVSKVVNEILSGLENPVYPSKTPF